MPASTIRRIPALSRRLLAARAHYPRLTRAAVALTARRRRAVVARLIAPTSWTREPAGVSPLAGPVRSRSMGLARRSSSSSRASRSRDRHGRRASRSPTCPTTSATARRSWPAGPVPRHRDRVPAGRCGRVRAAGGRGRRPRGVRARLRLAHAPVRRAADRRGRRVACARSAARFGEAAFALGIVALMPLMLGRVVLQRFDLMPAALSRSRCRGAAGAPHRAGVRRPGTRRRDEALSGRRCCRSSSRGVAARRPRAAPPPACSCSRPCSQR